MVLGMLGIMVVEVHLLVLDAVLTAVSMVIGLGTAQQETGRTNVTAVVKEDTLRETARTVLVLRRLGTCYFFKPLFFEHFLLISFWLVIIQGWWKLLQVTS